jgi:hypothetical protein
MSTAAAQTLSAPKQPAGPPALAYPSAAATLRAHAVRVPRMNAPGMSRPWSLLTAPLLLPAMLFGASGLLFIGIAASESVHLAPVVPTAEEPEK